MCTRLTRFTVSVPLDFKANWITPNGIFQNLHSRLLTHFVNNLPHSCRCIDLHLGLIGPKFYQSFRSFLSVEWEQIGEALRRLPALDSIYIHLDGYIDEPVPTWNSLRFNTVCEYLHPFVNYRRACSLAPNSFDSSDNPPQSTTIFEISSYSNRERCGLTA